MTASRWNADPSHSAVHFSIRHMVISKVRGAFSKWSATVDFDPKAPADAKVSARIEVASIDTHEAQRDGHLKSPDFFDAEKYPEITFQSTKVESAGKDRFRVLGDLTMHGVTRPVELQAEYLGAGKDPWGNERAGFQATAKLNRKDFGLGWNQVLEAGGVLVGEEVEVTLDLEAVRAKAGAEKAA